MVDDYDEKKINIYSSQWKWWKINYNIKQNIFNINHDDKKKFLVIKDSDKTMFSNWSTKKINFKLYKTIKTKYVYWAVNKKNWF